MPLEWVEGFPRTSRVVSPRIDIVTAKAGRPCEVWLLGNRILSAETHWDGDAKPKGRTVPCLGGRDCAYCKPPALLGTDPKAYLPARLVQSDVRVILQLSDGGAEDLKRIVQSRPSWRGLRLLCTRTGRRENSRLHVAFVCYSPDASLPEEFDPRPHVERAWGLRGGTVLGERKRAPRKEGR